LFVLYRSGLGVEPVDESRSLLQYLVSRQAEGALVGFLQQLEGQAQQLGVCDVQCSLASLEEVFLTIAKQVSVLFYYFCCCFCRLLSCDEVVRQSIDVQCSLASLHEVFFTKQVGAWLSSVVLCCEVTGSCVAAA
jgi:hypothetical protein